VSVAGNALLRRRHRPHPHHRRTPQFPRRAPRPARRHRRGVRYRRARCDADPSLLSVRARLGCEMCWTTGPPRPGAPRVAANHRVNILVHLQP